MPSAPMQRLGVGSYGTVCVHPDRSDVVVKQAGLFDNGKIRAPTLREAWFGSLHHDYYHDVVQPPPLLLHTGVNWPRKDRTWVSMLAPRAEADLLDQYVVLDAPVQFTIEQVPELLSCICRALVPLHENGLAHCDVHARNIAIVDEGQRFALLDNSVLPPGSQGNEHYISTDIVSLGVVVIEMLIVMYDMHDDDEEVVIQSYLMHRRMYESKHSVMHWVSRMVDERYPRPTALEIATALSSADSLQRALALARLDTFRVNRLRPYSAADKSVLRSRYVAHARFIARQWWRWSQLHEDRTPCGVPLAMNLLDRWLLRSSTKDVRSRSNTDFRSLAGACLAVACSLLGMLPPRFPVDTNYEPVIVSVLRGLCFDVYRPTIQTQWTTKHSEAYRNQIVFTLLDNPDVVVDIADPAQQTAQLEQLTAQLVAPTCIVPGTQGWHTKQQVTAELQRLFDNAAGQVGRENRVAACNKTFDYVWRQQVFARQSWRSMVRFHETMRQKLQQFIYDAPTLEEGNVFQRWYDLIIVGQLRSLPTC